MSFVIRRLKTTGQRLGAASTVVHIRGIPPINPLTGNVYSSNTTTGSTSSSQIENNFRYELNAANVGHCEAILCRSSIIHPLTRRFTIPHEEIECKRVRKTSNIIINEDNALNAITSQTRMLGCSFLYPAVLPTPHISSFILSKNDEFVIIANNLLWQVKKKKRILFSIIRIDFLFSKHLSHEEAVRAIRSISNPVLASKKLVDIAQSFGAKENLAVLIVRFNFQKKIHHITHKPPRQQKYSTNTSSGDHSPITSSMFPFDSMGYLSGGDLSNNEEDDSNEAFQISTLPTHDYFYHQSDQISSASDGPATLNDSIENRLLSRSDRRHFLATSLIDTSTIEPKKSDKLFQSDMALFNFPESNAQPVRVIPSDLTIVSEIISTSPTTTLSRMKKIKNPSLAGDSPSSTRRSGRYRKKLTPPARPPLGYSKPPRTDFSSTSDISTDGHDYDRSPTYPAGLRPVADAVLSASSSDDDDDDDFSYVVDQLSLTSTNTATDCQQQQNEIKSFVRRHYPSISSTTHSTVNSTLTSSSVTAANLPMAVPLLPPPLPPPPIPNKITRL